MADFRVTVPNEFGFIVITSTDFPLAVEGIGQLVQTVVKNLLTVPGRDVFNPAYGAGLRQVLPVSAHRTTEDRARADLGIAILKSEEEIKFFQNSGGDRVSADEALENLILESLEFDVEQSLWDVRLRLVSRAGRGALVSLAVAGEL